MLLRKNRILRKTVGSRSKFVLPEPPDRRRVPAEDDRRLSDDRFAQNVALVVLAEATRITARVSDQAVPQPDNTDAMSSFLIVDFLVLILLLSFPRFARLSSRSSCLLTKNSCVPCASCGENVLPSGLATYERLERNQSNSK